MIGQFVEIKAKVGTYEIKDKVRIADFGCKCSKDYYVVKKREGESKGEISIVSPENIIRIV